MPFDPNSPHTFGVETGGESVASSGLSRGEDQGEWAPTDEHTSPYDRALENQINKKTLDQFDIHGIRLEEKQGVEEPATTSPNEEGGVPTFADLVEEEEKLQGNNTSSGEELNRVNIQATPTFADLVEGSTHINLGDELNRVNGPDTAFPEKRGDEDSELPPEEEPSTGEAFPGNRDQAHTTGSPLLEQQIPSEGSPDVPKQSVEIAEDILAKFTERFPGIKKEDLESLEGFGELSRGQQRMVLENLAQLTVGRIREEAARVVEERSEAARSEGGFLGKVWIGLKESFGAKKIALAREEKRTAEEITRGGMDIHGEALRQLVSGMKEYGPGVKEMEDGTLRVEYLETNGLTPETAERVEAFNAAAQAFAEIPYAWSLEGASPKQREAYRSAELAFAMHKKEALGILKEFGGDTGAVKVMADIENKLTMQRFMTTCPDAVDELKQINDQSVWTKAIKSTVAERGLYFALGAATRSAVAGLVGTGGALIAAPVAAAVTGGLRGYLKAKDALREQDAAMRRGEKAKGGMEMTAKNMVEAGGEHGAAKKIELLMKRIDALDEQLAANPPMEEAKTLQKKKAQLVAFLNQRLDYAQEKINEGKMIFGEGNDRLSSQYELLSALTRGRAAAYVGSEELEASGTESYGRTETLERRINTLLEKTNERINAARKLYVTKQTAKAATIAAGFGALGGLSADLIKWMNGAQSTAMEKMFGEWDEVKAAALERMASAKNGLEEFFTDNAATDNTLKAAVETSVDQIGTANPVIRPIDIDNALEKGLSGAELVSREVAPGETLTRIFSSEIPELQGMSNEEVYRLLTTLTPEELRAINVSSSNIDLIRVGERLDLNAAREIIAQKLGDERILSRLTSAVHDVESSGGTSGKAPFEFQYVDEPVIEDRGIPDSIAPDASQVAEDTGEIMPDADIEPMIEVTPESRGELLEKFRDEFEQKFSREPTAPELEEVVRAVEESIASGDQFTEDNLRQLMERMAPIKIEEWDPKMQGAARAFLVEHKRYPSELELRNYYEKYQPFIDRAYEESLFVQPPAPTTPSVPEGGIRDAVWRGEGEQIKIGQEAIGLNVTESSAYNDFVSQYGRVPTNEELTKYIEIKKGDPEIQKRFEEFFTDGGTRAQSPVETTPSARSVYENLPEDKVIVTKPDGQHVEETWVTTSDGRRVKIFEQSIPESNSDTPNILNEQQAPHGERPMPQAPDPEAAKPPAHTAPEATPTAPRSPSLENMLKDPDVAKYRNHPEMERAIKNSEMNMKEFEARWRERFTRMQMRTEQALSREDINAQRAAAHAANRYNPKISGVIGRGTMRPGVNVVGGVSSDGKPNFGLKGTIPFGKGKGGISFDTTPIMRRNEVLDEIARNAAERKAIITEEGDRALAELEQEYMLARERFQLGEERRLLDVAHRIAENERRAATRAR